MGWIRRLRNTLPGSPLDATFAEEARFHLEERIDEYVKSGMTHQQAETEARRRLGNLTLAREHTRDADTLRWLEDLGQDVRYAARMLSKNPAFTCGVVLTIALGIGATTAIFTVVESVVLRPLAYDPENRLVRLMVHLPADSPTAAPLRTTVNLTATEVAQLKARSQALAYVGTAAPLLRGISGLEDAARLQASRVSASVFSALAARPILGRTLSAEDELPGAPAAVVLSFGAWRRYYNGDPNVVGRTIMLETILGQRTQTQTAVVGVMADGFDFPTVQTQMWLPFQSASATATVANRGPMLAQLQRGVSLESALADVGPIVRELRRPPPGAWYELVREHDEMVALVSPALKVLGGAVGFVLLISCVNVANLLLARTTARQREFSVRWALGAGRGRLLRQALTESVALAGAGGVAGTLLALAGVRAFRSLAATPARIDLGVGLPFPRLEGVSVDRYVLLFTIATSLMTGLLFGLAPAIAWSRTSTVKTQSRTKMQSGLVVAEISLSLILLVGSGLLVRSLLNLLSVDPGYNAAHVLTFQVGVSPNRYPDARLRAFAEDLIEEVRRVPGIQVAAYANQLPMVQLRDTRGGLWQTPDPTRKPTPEGADARLISRDYLRVMGIPVVAGRGFAESDERGHPRVLLVNQALAAREFGHESPVGRLMYIGRDVEPWEIVGVVGDVRQFGLDRAPEPQFFADLRQWSGGGPLFPVGAYYAVRTQEDVGRIVTALRAVVGRMDPQAALFNLAPMEQLVDVTVSRSRMYAVLLAVFAAVGSTLAVIGIYGLMAYTVTQRSKEIGIRMALGAQRWNVLNLVMGQSLRLTALGIALGLIGATGVTRYLEGMLFGLTALDWRTLVTLSIAFTGVATLAAYVPARHATRVNPLVALRHE
jgi:predicted permease